ncbi:BRAT1 [Lepeophtheirus salmonis]|uniref:BRAT1 n=1 Tax=Lepeophtheirus salmonis TaxID=72036 RepID=A0A0K2V8C7_LEPSM|nr:BRAT1 [Lepeophtheirus salmonis]CAF2875635.1 BRAT1 [Lepeophtheirus salmonis]
MIISLTSQSRSFSKTKIEVFLIISDISKMLNKFAASRRTIASVSDSNINLKNFSISVESIIFERPKDPSHKTTERRTLIDAARTKLFSCFNCKDINPLRGGMPFV